MPSQGGVTSLICEARRGASDFCQPIARGNTDLVAGNFEADIYGIEAEVNRNRTNMAYCKHCVQIGFGWSGGFKVNRGCYGKCGQRYTA